MSEEIKRKAGRPLKYPWLDMNVDDEIEMSLPKNNARVYICRVNNTYAPRKFRITCGDENTAVARRIE